jgi:VWFA-related protein
LVGAICVVVVPVLMLGGAALAAQQPAPPQPTFRAEVTLVTTDVIPRDKDGRFQSDLTKDDFVVVEDGEPQTIASFTLVHGGRIFNLLDPPVQPQQTEGIVLPPRRRAPDVGSGRVLVVFVDDLHFEAQYTPHVRRIVVDLVQNLLHDGDLVAMVSSGPSAIEIDPTIDRKLIASAANQIRGSAMTPAEIFQTLESPSGPADLRFRAQVAFQTMYRMLAAMDEVRNRRKAVLYVSAGYDFDPFVDGRFMRDRVMGGRFSDATRFLIDEENPYFRLNTVTADIDLYVYMRELTRSANRVNASIYTVDPRGLVGVTDAGQYVDQSEYRTFFNKTISTLRYIAEETGGFAVVNDNDFVSAFKRIDAETSDYYMIGYYPSNLDPTRRSRAIDVTVKRPDVTVQSRRSYSLKTAGTPPPPPPLKAPAKRQ